MIRSKQYSIVILVFALSLLVQIVSLFRTSILASMFGTSNEMDAFNLANTIMVCLVNVVGTSIVTVLIPYLTKMQDDSKSKQALNSYITLVLGATIGLLMIYFGIGSFYFYKVGSHADVTSFQQLTFQLTLFLGIGQFIRMITGIQTGILQVENKFISVKLVSLFSAFLSLLYLLFYHKLTIESVSICLSLSFIIECFLLFCIKREKKYRYFPVFIKANSDLQKLIQLTIPIVLNSALYQATVLIPNFLARFFGEGYVSMLVYSNQILNIMQALIILNLIMLLYPNLSRYFQKSIGQGKEKMILYMNISNMIVIPMVFGCILLGPLLIKLLFERGSFTEDSTYLVWKFLLFLSLSLPFVIVKEFLFRSFYSLEDTKIPVRISFVVILIQIAYLGIGSIFLGIYAIMTAPLFAAILSVIGGYTSLTKKIGLLDSKKQLISQHALILVNTAIMCLVVLLVKSHLFMNDIAVFLVSVVIGVLSYTLGIFILQRKYIKKIMTKEG